MPATTFPRAATTAVPALHYQHPHQGDLLDIFNNPARVTKAGIRKA
jgi:hypothetical protein